MRPVLRQLSRLFRRPLHPVCSERCQARVRLEVCQLEGRDVPSALTLGTVSGVVSALSANPTALKTPGVQVWLTGTSDAGAAVNLATTTDSTGAYVFRSVDEGNYQLTALAGSTFLNGAGAGVAVKGGQNSNVNLAVGGVVPGAISLRFFLTNATGANVGIPFGPAGATANSGPTVRQALGNITLASGGSQLFNAAAGFADPDTTNSQLLFDTNNGNLRINLFDSQAPQTVANYLDYVVNSRYDNTIFHRLSSLTQASGGGFEATPKQVLQGGGFQFDTTLPDLFPSVATSADPAIANEFNAARPNDPGTISMARQTDPNSATSQFFLNITDNPGLDTSPGFAVFGSIATDAESQATFTMLQDATSSDQSATNGAFANLPLKNFSGGAFPSTTVPENFLIIEDVKVVKLDERLSFSAVSSNPLVSVSAVAGHPEVFTLAAASGVTQATAVTVTVTATDQFGRSVQSSFTVTVNP